MGILHDIALTYFTALGVVLGGSSSARSPPGLLSTRPSTPCWSSPSPSNCGPWSSPRGDLPDDPGPGLGNLDGRVSAHLSASGADHQQLLRREHRLLAGPRRGGRRMRMPSRATLGTPQGSLSAFAGCRDRGRQRPRSPGSGHGPAHPRQRHPDGRSRAPRGRARKPRPGARLPAAASPSTPSRSRSSPLPKSTSGSTSRSDGPRTPEAPGRRRDRHFNPSLIEKALQRTIHVDKQDFVVAPTLIVLGQAASLSGSKRRRARSRSTPKRPRRGLKLPAHSRMKALSRLSRSRPLTCDFAPSDDKLPVARS